MLLNLERQAGFIRFPVQLWQAANSTTDFMTLIMRAIGACTPSFNGNPKAQRIQQLIECGAWTDAILALIDLELPTWKLRRVTYDDGEWHCSLSQNPAIPIEFDETADATHDNLALAMLGAFLAARTQGETSTKVSLNSAPQKPPSAWQTVCCANFA